MALPLSGETKPSGAGAALARYCRHRIAVRHTNVCGKGVATGTAGSPTVLKPGRDQMLPAVKPGIDGPLAGPDQRQRQAQRRQCHGNTSMGRRREGDPRLGARRPQFRRRGVQKPAISRMPASAPITCGAATVPPGVETAQYSRAAPTTQSLNQEPSARRTVCERGEQSLHRYPVFSLRNWQRF